MVLSIGKVSHKLFSQYSWDMLTKKMNVVSAKAGMLHDKVKAMFMFVYKKENPKQLSTCF